MNFFKPNFWDKNKISIFSILLMPIAFLVRLIFFLRKHLTKMHECSIPIICIGNIYLGGTGKTPVSIEIYSILKKLNINAAFIRKKYDSYKDEVIMQKNVGPVYESKKRINAIEAAKENRIQVALLDDGFQDFSFKKDLSILCFTEKQWIGNGHTIPSGPLRESLSGLTRADCVIINGKKNIDIEQVILSKNREIKIYYSKYNPLNIDLFINNKIIAFAGIGNPQNFFDMLQDNNMNILKTIKFPDHHEFKENELKKLVDESEKNNATLLTTEKDYLRLSEEYKRKINFLKISIEIENEDKLIEQLKNVI